LLADDELVRPTEEDLRGQVPAYLATQGTLDRDRLKRKLLPARGHIAAAPLACDDEVPTLDGGEAECHSLTEYRQSKGESNPQAGVNNGIIVI
jgi:hypothetical protein